MQKMLIYGRNLEESNQLRTFFETRLPYPAEISYSREDAEALLTSRPFHLLIWDTDSYGNYEATWVKELRAIGYSQPILIVSEDIDEQLFKSSIRNLKTYFLHKPFEYRALKGIARKLIVTRGMPQQMYKRFKTNQKLQIETYGSGETLESSMFNLSVGGAYFESDGENSLTVGDLVKMQVQLTDVDKSHMMNARVIWTTRKGDHSGGYGAGVKFVRNEEIYKTLMEKI